VSLEAGSGGDARAGMGSQRLPPRAPVTAMILWKDPATNKEEAPRELTAKEKKAKRAKEKHEEEENRQAGLEALQGSLRALKGKEAKK